MESVVGEILEKLIEECSNEDVKKGLKVAKDVVENSGYYSLNDWLDMDEREKSEAIEEFVRMLGPDESQQFSGGVVPESDMEYVVRIMYEEGKVWLGFSAPIYLDSVKFNSLEEATNYVEGKPAYDYLDDSVKLNAGEKAIDMVDERDSLVWENDELKMDNGQARVGDWYRQTYPTDELGTEIPDDLTFNVVYQGMKVGLDVYKLLGQAADSIVRERIFAELSKKMGMDYDVIYHLWLDGPKGSSELYNGKKPKIDMLIHGAKDKSFKEVVKDNIKKQELLGDSLKFR